MATPRRGLLGEYAGFVSRGAALILDIVLVSSSVIFINWLATLPLVFFTGVDAAQCVAAPGAYSTLIGLACRLLGLTWLVVALTASPLYFTVLFATTGQTVGMYVLGVRVVRSNGEPMTVWRGFLRWIGYFASALPLGLGFFWIFVNDQRRGFHDMMADTVVVYSWRARYNEFFLARVRRWLYGNNETKRIVPLNGHYSLVTVAVPDRIRMRNVLNIAENAVVGGDMEVLYTAVYVTDHHGVPHLFGITDLDETTDDLHLYDVQYDIPTAQLEQIRAEMEPDSFVVCVLLQEQYADTLVALISKRLPAQVRTYDMGTKAQLSPVPKVKKADDGLTALGVTPPASASVVTSADKTWPGENGRRYADDPPLGSQRDSNQPSGTNATE